MLRWGLLSYAMGFFVSDLLLKVPATVDSSAWYFGNMLLLLAIPLGLATVALYTSPSRAAPVDGLSRAGESAVRAAYHARGARPWPELESKWPNETIQSVEPESSSRAMAWVAFDDAYPNGTGPRRTNTR